MKLANKIKTELSNAVRTSIDLEPVGRSTFRLITPFKFEDGDCFVAYIEQSGDQIKFTDLGHTLMHVSYDVDITGETRTKILDRILATHSLKCDDGEIYTVCPISEVGLAFWDFVQGLIRISDISQWKFERAASLFFEEFASFMETRIKPKVPRVALSLIHI